MESGCRTRCFRVCAAPTRRIPRSVAHEDLGKSRACRSLFKQRQPRSAGAAGVRRNIRELARTRLPRRTSACEPEPEARERESLDNYTLRLSSCRADPRDLSATLDYWRHSKRKGTRSTASRPRNIDSPRGIARFQQAIGREPDTGDLAGAACPNSGRSSRCCRQFFNRAYTGGSRRGRGLLVERAYRAE